MRTLFPAPASRSIILKTWRCISLLAAVIVLTATTAAVSSAQAPAPIGGHFALTATDGSNVTDATYRGKWLLVYFGYTSCPDVCPTVLNEIGVALDGLGPLANKVQPIFITVDPVRDTARGLAAYLESFDSRIVGLRRRSRSKQPRKPIMSIIGRGAWATVNTRSTIAPFSM